MKNILKPVLLVLAVLTVVPVLLIVWLARRASRRPAPALPLAGARG